MHLIGNLNDRLHSFLEGYDLDINTMRLTRKGLPAGNLKAWLSSKRALLLGTMRILISLRQKRILGPRESRRIGVVRQVGELILLATGSTVFPTAGREGVFVS